MGRVGDDTAQLNIHVRHFGEDYLERGWLWGAWVLWGAWESCGWCDGGVVMGGGSRLLLKAKSK